MKNSEFSQGGAKKFLYTGAKKEQDDQDDLPWNFNSKNSSPRGTANQMNGKLKFDMDDVWSIKKNVNIGNKAQNNGDEKLTYNTDKSYYSRYRGGPKDKDDFDSAFGGNANTDTGGKSWNIGGQSHRPFSYSYGAETKPISPRNVSNSSAGMYPQNGQNGFGSQTRTGFGSQTGSGFGSSTGSSNMNAGNSNLNLNSNFGTNINSVPPRNSNSNNFSNNSGPMYNKVSSSSSYSVGGQSSTTTTSPSKNINSLFGQPTRNTMSLNRAQNNNLSPTSRTSSEGGSVFNRQNKSFW